VRVLPISAQSSNRPACHIHDHSKITYTDQKPPPHCRYLTLHFHIASLLLKSQTTSTAARSELIRKARTDYDRYLKQLDNYDILSKAEARLYEQLKEAPDTFSTASTTDASTRRGTKIARFKEEKALKEKMAVCGCLRWCRWVNEGLGTRVN
jgi:hypothetical protein